MVSTIITILINVLAFGVGLYIGSIIFGKDEPPKVDTETQNPVKLYHPIVLSFEFRQTLTKAKLMEDVLKPSWYQFAHHWDCITDLNPRILGNLDNLADKIMSWYNPEYNELLLIAHNDDKIGFTIDFTWKKPKQMGKLVCHADAVEGLEHYYKDAK